MHTRRTIRSGRRCWTPLSSSSRAVPRPRILAQHHTLYGAKPYLFVRETHTLPLSALDHIEFDPVTRQLQSDKRADWGTNWHKGRALDWNGILQLIHHRLERPDVDIVAIYTPDHLHGNHIVQAFEAGKHVICTKPLVNSVDAARRILDAGRRTGNKLLVGQSTRFFESFQRQRRAYEANEIGDLECLDAHYIHRMDWYYEKSPWAADSTDRVYLGLSHPLDLARWYLGPVEEVSAYGAKSALAREFNINSFDMYVVNLKASDGRIGRVFGHYGLRELPSVRNAIELLLFGSGGTSRAQYHDMRYAYTRTDGTEVTEDALYSKRAVYFNNEVHGMHYGEFANYTEYFARALLSDQNYSPGLEEGLETFCVMEAVKRSVQTGLPAKIAPLLAEIGL